MLTQSLVRGFYTGCPAALFPEGKWPYAKQRDLLLYTFTHQDKPLEINHLVSEGGSYHTTPTQVSNKNLNKDIKVIGKTKLYRHTTVNVNIRKRERRVH